MTPKATKFCEIFTLLLTVCTVVKISQSISCSRTFLCVSAKFWCGFSYCGILYKHFRLLGLWFSSLTILPDKRQSRKGLERQKGLIPTVIILEGKIERSRESEGLCMDNLHTGQLSRHLFLWQVTILRLRTWDLNYTPGVDFLDHDFL